MCAILILDIKKKNMPELFSLWKFVSGYISGFGLLAFVSLPNDGGGDV